MTNHVVSIGGGLASTWKLPQRVIEQYGPEDVHLVMARLPNEDPDVWRLCEAVEDALGKKITYIGDGLTPWDIFHKVKFIGNSRIDPCSRILKREALDTWIRAHFAPEDTIRYIGFTYDEAHRWIDYQKMSLAKGYRVDAPLMYDPSVTRETLVAECRELFGFVPRLYEYGFSHNNCGGACIKAGHKEWARLLKHIPEVYAWWEENEAKFQRDNNKEVTVLRDRRGGTVKPLSLKAFRERMEQKWADEEKALDPFAGLEESSACSFCLAG